MASVSIFKSKNQSEAGTIHWLNECIKRGQREIFSEVVDMNPGLAAELLRRNHDNRNIKPTKAQHFVADMIAGRWEFNGEPIIISQDGSLNDGQHRIQAVADANIVLPMLVVFGVTRDSRLTVDQGSAKTAGDFLHMQGALYSTHMASMARVLMAFEASGGKNISSAGRFTNAQLLLRISADLDIGKAAAYAVHVNKHTQRFSTPAVIGACYYILSDINAIEAQDYMDRVCVGEGLRRNDPAFTVRETLLRLGKQQRQPKMEVIFHGWNKHRARQHLKLIRVNGSFPALV